MLTLMLGNSSLPPLLRIISLPRQWKEAQSSASITEIVISLVRDRNGESSRLYP